MGVEEGAETGESGGEEGQGAGGERGRGVERGARYSSLLHTHLVLCWRTIAGQTVALKYRGTG